MLDDMKILTAWNQWKEYKRAEHRFKYKTPISERMALHRLMMLAGNDIDKAIEILETSIANGWKGLFRIKENGTTKEDRLRDFING